jgi:AAHS family 4-hydroxybenzoate transporter-like MFS transporter
MLIQNGFNIGAMLVGFVALYLIPSFGWRSIFYFGGVVPLVIGLFMLVFLPESLQFLALYRQHDRLLTVAQTGRPRRDGDAGDRLRRGRAAVPRRAGDPVVQVRPRRGGDVPLGDQLHESGDRSMATRQ